MCQFPWRGGRDDWRNSPINFSLSLSLLIYIYRVIQSSGAFIFPKPFELVASFATSSRNVKRTRWWPTRWARQSLKNAPDAQRNKGTQIKLNRTPSPCKKWELDPFRPPSLIADAHKGWALWWPLSMVGRVRPLAVWNPIYLNSL